MLSYTFSSKQEPSKICQITFTSKTCVIIEENNIKLEFSEEGKPAFKSESGEIVIEYSGLASDGNAERTWAIAKFSPQGYSPLHFHKERTENYYIVEGEAKVMVDNQEYILPAGSHIQIHPGEKHQVLNPSETEGLVLIVKCEPAWIIEDSHIVND